MSIIIAIVLLNLMMLTVFMIIWNQIEQRFPIKSFLTVCSIYNASIIIIWLITDFSLSELMSQWTNVFNTSLEHWYIYSISFLIIFAITVIPYISGQFKQLSYLENRQYLVVGMIFVLIAFGIWLPFGFNSAGHFEIWTIKRYLMFGPPDHIASEMVTRLSARIPHTVAHLINPYGFDGHHILHFISFVGKGVFLFAILKKFNVENLLAFSIAIIFMIYPSGTEVMSVRSHAHIVRVSMFLLAVYSFLTYVIEPGRLKLLSFLVAMYFTITSVEYVIFLILPFPILLFYFEKRLTHRFYNLSIIWYTIPSMYICYYYIISRFTKVYGSQFLKYDSLLDELVASLLAIARGTYILLFEGWVITFPSSVSFSYLVIAVGITTLVFVAGFQLIRNRDASGFVNYRINILTGIVVILGSIALFSIIPEYRESDWRIHTYGSLGASIITVSVLRQITNQISNKSSGQLVFLCLVSIFFGLAYNHAIHQYEYYWNSAQTKVNFLEFTRYYESVSSEPTWVFMTELTEDELKGKLEHFSNEWLRNAALEVSNRSKAISKNTYFCYMALGNCQFDAIGLRYKANLNSIAPDILVPYDQIVLFEIKPDLTARLLETLPENIKQLPNAEELYQPLSYFSLRQS
jgi:hypothetical protein